MKLGVWVFALLLVGRLRVTASQPETKVLNTEGARAFAAGNLSQAERLFTLAASLRNSEADEASILYNLAAVSRGQGRYPKAALQYREAIRLRGMLSGEDDVSLTGPLSGLALTTLCLGAVDEAERIARQAVRISAKAAVAEQLTANHALAQVLAAQLRFADAEALALLALNEAVPESVRQAEVYTTLATIDRQMGQSAKAEEYAGHAADILERTLGAEHRSTAAAWNNLAQAKLAQGKVAEARVLLEKVLLCWKNTLAPGHPSFSFVLTNLGYLELGAKHAKKAQRLFEQAAEIDAVAFGRDSAKAALDRNHIACALAAQGKTERAVGLFSDALARLQQVYGPEHADVGLVSGNLALAFARLRRWQEAEPLFRRAIRVREVTAQPNDAHLFSLLESYALVLRGLEDYSEAASVDARAMRIRVRSALRNQAN